MSNETLFYICGVVLAVSAVLVSFTGLKVKGFPGRALPIVVLWFAIIVGGATTFAVLHAQDEEQAKAAEFGQAGEEIEEEQGSAPFEEEEEENPEGEAGGGEEEVESEAEAPETGGEEEAGATGGPAGDPEAGEQVFAGAGCAGCHTFKAAGAGGTIGPNLDEVLTAGTDEAKIEEDIVDPEAEIVDGYSPGIMPSNFSEQLSEEELADVVAFVYTNSPAGEGK